MEIRREKKKSEEYIFNKTQKKKEEKGTRKGTEKRS